jgi:hypothetical protein
MLSVRKISSMEFDVSFTNKEVTPWGGMVFLKQLLDKIGFKDQILKCEDLPQPQSNRGHTVSVILEAFNQHLVWSQ